MIRKQLISLLSLTETDLKEPVIVKRHPEHSELFFLILNNKVNTFTPQFVRKIQEALNEIENNEGDTVMVTCSLHPSIFSAGLDLHFLQSCDSYEFTNLALEALRMFARFMSFPVPTIALVAGHAVAAGCCLALSHDWRYAKSEAGHLMAMNEIERGLTLPPGLSSILQTKLHHLVYREMILTAKKYDLGREGVQYGLIDQTIEEAQLLQFTIEKALIQAKFGANKKLYSSLKAELHKEAIDACCNKQLGSGLVYDLGVHKPKL